MKKENKLKKKDAFTLVEMILVLSIVTLLVLITIPNIARKKEIINEVGCDALIEVVNSQILVYELSNGNISDINELVKDGYLTESQTVCPTGQKIVIENGQAVAK